MLCEKCGTFLGERFAPVPVYCHKCDDHHYDKAVPAGVYDSALAATIVRLKTAPDLPNRLRLLVSETVKRTDLTQIDLIVPVPLAKQRQLERGFNQAEIVARVISRSATIPIDSFSLTRKLHTPIHRIGMDQRARELTVEKAFEVVRPKLIDGKGILLVDDVLTSGATASACARVLKKSGASKVLVFTLARAVMH